MKCCVVVKVSRRTVAFWYQVEGKRPSPLTMRGSHVVPLYFCVDHGGFSFGAAARDRFYANDPNAYGNYFDLIADPSKHFTLHGSSKRIKQLLYYGIEQFLSHFLNTILYDKDSIESHRPGFPLKFIFEPDLSEPERSLVKSLFTEAGYSNVTLLSYHDVVIEYLKQTGAAGKASSVLYLCGLDDTLYVELYTQGLESPVASVSMPGQGADPRIRILAGMVVEYIGTQNHHLNLDTAVETAALLPFCAGLLAEAGPILSGEAELSKGGKFWFNIKMKSVEDRLQYYAGDMMVSASISELLQKHAVRAEDVLVLLGSDEIKTPYFSERILKSYAHVRAIEAAHLEGAMQMIFDKSSAVVDGQRKPVIIAQPPLPPVSPPLPPVKPKPPVKPAPPPLPVAKPGAIKTAVVPPLPGLKTQDTQKNKPIIPPPLPTPKKS